MYYPATGRRQDGLLDRQCSVFGVFRRVFDHVVSASRPPSPMFFCQDAMNDVMSEFYALSFFIITKVFWRRLNKSSDSY